MQLKYSYRTAFLPSPPLKERGLRPGGRYEAYLMGDWYALFRELNYYGLCRVASILEDVKREKFVQEHKFKLPLGDK